MSSFETDGSSVTKEGTEKTDFRKIVREEIAAWSQDPLGFEQEFKSWIPEWVTQAGLDIPISQIVGFTQFTAKDSTFIATTETTTSTTYVDLATAGPLIEGLPDGKYVVDFGCAARNSAGAVSRMSVQVNAVTVADNDACLTSSSTATSVSRGMIVTLDNAGNNSLTAKYRVTGGTGTFELRYLYALKFSNV